MKIIKFRKKTIFEEYNLDTSATIHEIKKKINIKINKEVEQKTENNFKIDELIFLEELFTKQEINISQKIEEYFKDRKSFEATPKEMVSLLLSFIINFENSSLFLDKKILGLFSYLINYLNYIDPSIYYHYTDEKHELFTLFVKSILEELNPIINSIVSTMSWDILNFLYQDFLELDDTYIKETILDSLYNALSLTITFYFKFDRKNNHSNFQNLIMTIITLPDILKIPRINSALDDFLATFKLIGNDNKIFFILNLEQIVTLFPGDAKKFEFLGNIFNTIFLEVLTPNLLIDYPLEVIQKIFINISMNLNPKYKNYLKIKSFLAVVKNFIDLDDSHLKQYFLSVETLKKKEFGNSEVTKLSLIYYKITDDYEFRNLFYNNIVYFTDFISRKKEMMAMKDRTTIIINDLISKTNSYVSYGGFINRYSEFVLSPKKLDKYIKDFYGLVLLDNTLIDHFNLLIVSFKDYLKLANTFNTKLKEKIVEDFYSYLYIDWINKYYKKEYVDTTKYNYQESVSKKEVETIQKYLA
ncbi:MAG: hypothetical protein LBV58_01915 [Acholeplasmatales bacterium]|jgi:hypothetical protein|nr:hypothetical protein [Acholeplasmatales bacterium]